MKQISDSGVTTGAEFAGLPVGTSSGLKEAVSVAADTRCPMAAVIAAVVLIFKASRLVIFSDMAMLYSSGPILPPLFLWQGTVRAQPAQHHSPGRAQTRASRLPSRQLLPERASAKHSCPCPQKDAPQKARGRLRSQLAAQLPFRIL